MTVIESAITKNKKEKKATYVFTVNNEVFEAHHYTGKQSKLEIIHSGTLIGTVEKPRVKSEFMESANAVKITAWIEKGNFLGSVGTGVGIEANGKPVQHTLADPDVHIKNGLTGLYFLVIIFLIKSIANLFSGGGFSGAFLYLISLFITVLAVIKYKSWTKFSITAGLILGLLEMVDYAAGLFTMDMRSVAGSVAWILVRIGAITCLVNAFKWRRKAAQSLAVSDAL